MMLQVCLYKCYRNYQYTRPDLVRTNSIFESRKVWSSAAESELAQVWEGSNKFCCLVDAHAVVVSLQPVAEHEVLTAQLLAVRLPFLFLILWATGSAGDTGKEVRWALFPPLQRDRLSSSCMYLPCHLLRFSCFLNSQGLSFAEIQPVPITLPLLFQDCSEIALFPYW